MFAIRNRKGQGLTEYVICVALVGLAVLLAVKIFGERVEQKNYRATIQVMKLKDAKP